MTERPDQPPITSPRSERVRRIAALAGRSARRRQQRFRIEGPQAIRSLLTHRADLAQELFLTERAGADHPELAALAAGAGVPVRAVGDQIIRALVRDGAAASPDATDGGGGPAREAVNPQGAIAVGRLSGDGPVAACAAVADLPSHEPVTVAVLHQVRDPGNVGTLIRTADAAGAGLVVLTRTSADPYAPKVVRAAAGSLFHLPVVAGAEAPALLEALAEAGITAAATSGRGGTDVFTAELPQRIAWIVGNEAHGLDPDTLAAAALQVRIPLAGRAESLNVHTAATVCLFETLRRRRERP